MPRLDEFAANTGSQLSSVLHSAVETISSSQQITFRLYVRKVLPLDGFVYWVNAAILTDAEQAKVGLPLTRVISGSLHRQVVSEQSESATGAINNVIFTPLEQADDLNTVDPDAVYFGEYDGTQFAFSRMESRYTQAGIYHYRGTAILPTMRTQIIEKAEDISDEQILSNSIPIWLSLNQFATIYPSFLSPSNLRPPYIVADVRATSPLQSAPHYDVRCQHVADQVRLTLYGLTNAQALQFVDYVVSTALEDEEFGITNVPVVIDGKRTQVEMGVLARQKFVDFDINYYQSTALDVSHQLIKKAIINYEVK
ncbi:hypothetical protein F3I27_22935 [Pantoea sp. Bo_2]|uniref:hypothetical protein n=1 Tax=unclassified Pantoea TaxID=2630326 RepID=UPI0012321C8F|nr:MULTISPECIES: hypothetical protein [unclassified Pantoea]KAA5940521.1 hypothetical protein F3I57_17535 [Pantoea sp. VH_3]KAA5949666.1 hypothetical protein F3I56_17415 [Pantoea sp. VH_25]KAA5955393.1 hypothetical protein F3I55_12470 [Pantoea sp. VH_24]KAA5958986.1 hypothetical protein F3I53_13780 [Pantoea sp. VH_16]KAA5964184.1 hypothetical protein F3I54_13620 [Pantoea sp. VH_18]